MAPERNPYVGPQPFETEDADRFFGRTREIRDLTSLVIAHRVVLLYSASGAGKSSLINAGVVPALVERGYQVLAGGRVGAPVPAGAHAANVFSASLISQWDAEMHASTVAGLLAAFPRGSDEEGSPQPRVLVIDQFEEIFTAHPAHWNVRTSFFVELLTPEHLEALADLDVVLGRFYEDALSAAAERARVRERRLRRWVWDELVTPGGTRGTVYRGPDASAGLPNAAVDVLEDKRLIRAEERAGAKWYELTHDRLIEPIRRSNERFSARRRRTLLKTAVALAPILLIGLPLGIGFGVGGGKSSSGGVVVPAALTPSGLG